MYTCVHMYVMVASPRNSSQCIEFLGSNCFTAEQYSKLAELLKDALDMCFTRANERLARRHDEDYDEMVEEELEEEASGHDWVVGREGYEVMGVEGVG